MRAWAAISPNAERILQFQQEQAAGKVQGTTDRSAAFFLCVFANSLGSYIIVTRLVLSPPAPPSPRQLDGRHTPKSNPAVGPARPMPHLPRPRRTSAWHGRKPQAGQPASHSSGAAGREPASQPASQRGSQLGSAHSSFLAPVLSATASSSAPSSPSPPCSPCSPSTWYDSSLTTLDQRRVRTLTYSLVCLLTNVGAGAAECCSAPAPWCFLPALHRGSWHAQQRGRPGQVPYACFRSRATALPIYYPHPAPSPPPPPTRTHTRTHLNLRLVSSLGRRMSQARPKNCGHREGGHPFGMAVVSCYPRGAAGGTSLAFWRRRARRSS